MTQFDSTCICTHKMGGPGDSYCGKVGTAFFLAVNGHRCPDHVPVPFLQPLAELAARQQADRLANPYQKELDFFTDAMRYKLIKNAHKGRWEEIDLKMALKLLKDEVAELEEAIEAGSQIDIIMEGADIGNFAMIVTNIAVTEAAKRGGR